MLPAKKKETILILCYILLRNFIFYKLSSFCRHQTNLALKSSNGVNISRERCFLLCIVPYVCFPFLCWIKFFSGCFRLFFIWETKKKWSLVALDRWSCYTVTIAWEFAGADWALVILDEWSSYRGGRLNRFDCNVLS